MSAVAGVGLLAFAGGREVKNRLFPALAGAALLYRGWSGRCSVYRALGKTGIAAYPAATAVRAQRGVHFKRAITIQESPEKIYFFWRNLQNLPRIIPHLISVAEQDTVSRWTAEGPWGRTITWEAEIIEDRPGSLLAWRSVPGFALDTAGSLRLTPLSHDRGTAVHLTMKYDPPAGAIGASIAKLFGSDLEADLETGLRKMKQLFETGENCTIDQQPHGTC